jgi:hypothetical protein
LFRYTLSNILIEISDIDRNSSFFKGKRTVREGDVVKQPALAKTLKGIFKYLVDTGFFSSVLNVEKSFSTNSLSICLDTLLAISLCSDIDRNSSFFKGKRTVREGDVVKQPALAKTLKGTNSLSICLDTLLAISL